MSATRDKEGTTGGKRDLEPNTHPDNGEAWDPLASVRKTISPTQRIRLLKMHVPILPPEDFLDTADLQRRYALPSRRFLPLVFGLGGALLVLLFVALWLRFWPTPSNPDENTPQQLAPAAALGP